MTYLAIMAFFVLIAGFVLWKFSAYFANKKRKPKGSDYFKTRMKDKFEER